MVAGGYSGSWPGLDTTEVYKDNEWRTVSGKLPRAMQGMEAAAIYHKILLFGIYHHFMSVLFFISKNFRWMGWCLSQYERNP